MPRPRATIAPHHTPAADTHADSIRHLRALEAAHAVDHADAITTVRTLTALLLDQGASATAIATHLRDTGIPIGESLIRRWADHAAKRPVRDTPTWLEIIDHRPVDQVRADLEHILGMAVDGTDAPSYQVPVTAAQVEALQAALPDTIMGPVDETYGRDDAAAPTGAHPCAVVGAAGGSDAPPA